MKSNVRAPVATAELLLNFQTHQICLSFSDSEKVIRQQETETIHVSMFTLLLYLQPVGLGLLVQLLTSGVQHSADILADARDFAFHAFQVQTGFPMRRLRHNSSNSIMKLDEMSWFALLDFRVHPFFPALPLQTFRLLVQLKHELHRELLAHILSCSFEACVL